MLTIRIFQKETTILIRLHFQTLFLVNIRLIYSFYDSTGSFKLVRRWLGWKVNAVHFVLDFQKREDSKVCFLLDHHIS